MNTIIEGLRQILGPAEFMITEGDLAGQWNYAAMIEYFVAAMILSIVVASLFRLVGRLFKR